MSAQLWAGQVADVDLTGGTAERWTLKGPERNVEKEQTGMVFSRVTNLKEAAQSLIPDKMIVKL